MKSEYGLVSKMTELTHSRFGKRLLIRLGSVFILGFDLFWLLIWFLVQFYLGSIPSNSVWFFLFLGNFARPTKNGFEGKPKSEIRNEHPNGQISETDKFLVGVAVKRRIK